MKSARWFLALALVLALVPLALAGGKPTAVLARDLDAALDDAATTSTGTPVVIQLRDGATLSGPLAALAASSRKVGHGALVAALDRAALDRLATDPAVLSLSPDREIRANLDVGRPAVNGDLAYAAQGVTGRGVTVALIDSGLAPGVAVPETRVLARIDFVDSRGRAKDGFGHGTHIAGIIGGRNGVAPETNFVVLRVLDD